ncbi:hypothetical protein HK100_000851, partial [Physocladia obscura]
MALDASRDAFAKWMRGELQKPQQEFHEDLQRIRLNWIYPILREFNRLPEQDADSSESDDGTYVGRATKAICRLLPYSGPTEPTRTEGAIPRHLASTRIEPVIDPFQDVKSLLQKYGPLASKRYTTTRQEFSDSYDTPVSAERRRYQGSDVAEMKMRLTEQIRQSLYYVAAMTNKTNGYHLFIGEKLIQLLDEFRK